MKLSHWTEIVFTKTASNQQAAQLHPSALFCRSFLFRIFSRSTAQINFESTNNSAIQGPSQTCCCLEAEAKLGYQKWSVVPSIWLSKLCIWAHRCFTRRNCLRQKVTKSQSFLLDWLNPTSNKKQTIKKPAAKCRVDKSRKRKKRLMKPSNWTSSSTSLQKDLNKNCKSLSN